MSFSWPFLIQLSLLFFVFSVVVPSVPSSLKVLPSSTSYRSFHHLSSLLHSFWEYSGPFTDDRLSLGSHWSLTHQSPLLLLSDLSPLLTPNEKMLQLKFLFLPLTRCRFLPTSWFFPKKKKIFVFSLNPYEFTIVILRWYLCFRLLCFHLYWLLRTGSFPDFLYPTPGSTFEKVYVCKRVHIHARTFVCVCVRGLARTRTRVRVCVWGVCHKRINFVKFKNDFTIYFF